MTPNDVVRRFEQKLVAARTVAAGNTAFEKYEAETLPPLGDKDSGFAQQNFVAGWDAAMTAVRGILIPIQSEVLRAPQEET